MECDKCGKMLLNRELENKVLKAIGIESNGVEMRAEKLLCDECYEKAFNTRCEL